MNVISKFKSIKSSAAEYSSTEFKLLINLFILVTTVLIFVLVSREVVQGGTQKFDEFIFNFFRTNDLERSPRGAKWITAGMMDITALGGITIIFLITGAVFFYLLIQKKYEMMWLILFATIGGAFLSLGLKELFARERPPALFHLVHVKSLSFPSGHAVISSVVYLTQAALLAKSHSGNSVKVYILSVALVLVFLIGISRIYLGVHYPTDVLAGWSVGLAWASFCWLAAKYFQKRNERVKSVAANIKC